MNTATAESQKIEQLEASLERQKARLRDLATMGAVITSIHEIDAVLSVVMDLAIRLVDGEVGLIMLVESDRLESKISWGLQESVARSLTCTDGRSLAEYCLETGETVILTDIDQKASEGVNLKSVIAVPLKQSDRSLGVAILVNKSRGGDYTDDDREILEVLFDFAAVAVDNSHMLQDKLIQQKMKQEMAFARQVQKTLLPESLEDINGAEIGAVYIPAREVGGDFYDILRIDDTKFMAVLGDVSNKGVPAALVMSALSGVLKTALKANPDISVSTLTETLNNILAHEIIKDRDMFVTLFISKFDLAEKRLTYCNAGHPSGLFWEAARQEVHELSATGPIVGQFADITYQQGERELGANDRLFLFTDGITEAADAENRLFGKERVQETFAREIDLSPMDFCRYLKELVDRFAEGAHEDSHDDFTLVQVKVE